MKKSWNWIDGKNFYVLVAIFLALAAGKFCGLYVGKCYTLANSYKCPSNLWKGIIGEAVGEGYQGMYAVTCVYRNRLKKIFLWDALLLKGKTLTNLLRSKGKNIRKWPNR